MLEVKHLIKNFNQLTVLNDVNLQLHAGEFFSLLGPSGCGKTTLLRILAGFEDVDQGEVYWKGQNILSLEPQKRPFNMVFQSHALFPHLSVSENILFGLRLKKTSGEEMERRLKQMLDLVKLNGFEHKNPQTLSGGQAQRVALARALINEPEILLLDEPLSALDEQLKVHMQKELRWLQKKLGITFIYVTHDQEEAMALSDRVAILSAGELVQVSEPKKLYLHPEKAFSARFVGAQCEFHGTLEKIEKDSVDIRLQSGELWRGQWRENSKKAQLGDRVVAFLRPEKWRIQGGSDFNRADVQIFHQIFKGAYTENQILFHDHFYRWHTSQDTQLNSRIELFFSPQDLQVFEGIHEG